MLKLLGSVFWPAPRSMRGAMNPSFATVTCSKISRYFCEFLAIPLGLQCVLICGRKGKQTRDMLGLPPAEDHSRNSLQCSLRTEDSPEGTLTSDTSIRSRRAKILHLLCRKKKYLNRSLSNPQEHSHAGWGGVQAEEAFNDRNFLFLSSRRTLCVSLSSF